MCAGDKQIQVMAYVRVSGHRLLAKHLQKKKKHKYWGFSELKISHLATKRGAGGVRVSNKTDNI